MRDSEWAPMPAPVGYCQIIITATVPGYGLADNGNKLTSGIVDSATVPVDNGAGDFTITLTRPVANKLLSVLVMGRGASTNARGGSAVVASANTVRITTGAGAALADFDCDVYLFEFASVPPL